MREELFKKLDEFIWLNKAFPSSIGEFCKQSEISPQDFRKEFEDEDVFYSSILIESFEAAYKNMETEAAENEYEEREKSLALFFNLVHEFSKFPYFFRLIGKMENTKKYLPLWRKFNKLFVEKTAFFQKDTNINWVKDKLPNSITSEMNGLLFAWNYVFRVWLADKTEKKEKTDAAIEKVIHLYFDFSNTQHLQQLIDFGKFAFTTKVAW